MMRVYHRLIAFFGLFFLYSMAHATVDIVVNQTDSPDPVASGGNITYTINVANNGPDDATGVSISDVLPVGTTLVSVTTSQGTCSGTTTISCALGNIDNNLSADITIVVKSPNTAGTLTNTVTSTRNEVDSNSTNDSDTDQTTVTVSSDIRMVKTDSKDPVAQGENYSYTLTMTNLGPQPFPVGETLTVTDTIPAGMRLRSIPTGTGFTCTSDQGTTFPQNGPVVVTCTYTRTDTALAVNVNFPPISVRVVAVNSGNLINSANVTSPRADNNTANNTETEQTTISQAADLTATKSTRTLTDGNITTLSSGTTYTYRLQPRLVIGDTTGATVTLTDVLPNNITVVSDPVASNSSGTWNCSYSPAQTLPFTVSSSNPVTLTCTSTSSYTNTAVATATLADIKFNFQPTAAGTLNNSTTIAITGFPDPVSGNNTASVSNSVLAGSDLQITKTASGSPTKPINTNFTYSLIFRNAGPSAIPTGTVATINDAIPAGIRINATGNTIPAGWTCSPALPLTGPANFTCTNSSGIPVTTGTTTMTLSATTMANGHHVNIADISSTQPDTDSSNNQATAYVDVYTPGGGGNVNDLVLTKLDTAAGGTYGPDPVAISGQVKYRLRVTNQGPNNMTNAQTITVTEYVPTGTTILSMTPVNALSGWVCSGTFPAAGPTTRSCVRTIATSSANTRLNLNESTDIDVVLRADTGTSTTNNAQVFASSGDPIGYNDSASETTAILTDANLRITKTASASSIYYGQNVVYTFTVTNLGSVAVPAGSTGTIRLIDDMRTGNIDMTHVSNTGAANGWTCTTSGTGGADPLTCDYDGGLAVNGSTTFTVTATPRNGTTGVAAGRVNTVSIAYLQDNTHSPVVADPDFTDNSSSVSIDVLPTANMGVSKTASVSTAAVGQNLSYVVTVNNAGPNTATNPVMVDTLPANVSVQSIMVTGGGTCQQNVPSAGKIQCTWATMNSGNAQSVTIVVKPTNAASGTTITNSASVSATETDLVSSNNTSSANVTVTPASIDLVLNKTDAVDPIPRTGTETYTVTVNNLGPSLATDVIVTETLPHTYLNFISATPSQGTCGTPNASHVMTCNLGNIDAAETATITIQMSADVIGTDTNTASVTANEPDANSANNSVSENTTVQLGTDLILTKTVDKQLVILNTPFVYHINVQSTGPANTIATVVDSIPSEVTYQSVSTTRGTCSYAAPTLTCSLGLMAPNDSAQIDITVNPIQPGDFTNVATVNGSAPELVPSNNAGSAPIQSRLRIQGLVFEDNSGTTLVAANAYNGTQQAGENGLGNVTITLNNCSGTTIATTQTNADGRYEFLLSQALPLPQFCVNETDLAGYNSVSGQPVASYQLAQDRFQITTTPSINYSGLNFGDALLKLILTEDGLKTVAPGSVADYSHTLQAQSVLTPTALTASLTQQPAGLGWTQVLYIDSNCNKQLDPAETTPASFSTLFPGQTICLIERVNAPAAAPNGAQSVSTLVATYTATLQGGTVYNGSSNTRTDTTLIGISGQGALVMEKKVRTLASCPGVAASTGFATTSQARQGDCLEYEITYRNNSSRTLNTVTVKDEVPNGTLFKTASCQTTPAGNSCTVTSNPAVNGTGPLVWKLASGLLPGETGTVRFCVQLPALAEPPLK